MLPEFAQKKQPPETKLFSAAVFFYVCIVPYFISRTVKVNKRRYINRCKNFVIVQVRQTDYSEEIINNSAALLKNVFCRRESSACCDKIINNKKTSSLCNIRFVSFYFGSAVLKRIFAAVCCSGQLALFADKHKRNTETFGKRSGKQKSA